MGSNSGWVVLEFLNYIKYSFNTVYPMLLDILHPKSITIVQKPEGWILNTVKTIYNLCLNESKWMKSGYRISQYHLIVT